MSSMRISNDSSSTATVNIVAVDDIAGFSIDPGSFSRSPSRLSIDKMIWVCSSGSFEILWDDGSSGFRAFLLTQGHGQIDLSDIGGLHSSGIMNATGSILVRPVSSSNFTLILEIGKI